MPTVAVITPLYNKQRYVQRTLDSVLGQSFTDFEHVIVDDGSTDDGPAIVRRCDDPRVRLIEQPNAGPAAARHRGVQATNTPLLAFIDADDEWAPGFLDTLVEAMRTHAPCGLAACSRFTAPDDAPPHEHKVPIAGVVKPDPQRTVDELIALIESITSSNQLMRRELFDRLGGFYHETRCTSLEDHYLWMQVLLSAPVYFADPALATIHTGASNLSRNRSEALPLPPMLSDPARLRRNCPADFEDQLERWILRYAALDVAKAVRGGDVERVRWVLDHHPAVVGEGVHLRGARLDLALARIGIRFMPAYRLLRQLVHKPASWLRQRRRR